MFNTSNFKTKTIFIERKNESLENVWTIALDIGYSSVKGFSANTIYSFPSYARKLSGQLLGFADMSANDILYKDNATGEIWIVGASAQDMIAVDETSDSLAELYGRNRYFSELFKVVAEVGMGLGMTSNTFGSPNGKPLTLQTGLPPAYLKTDSSLLRESLGGEHNFSIKVGNKPWISYNFTLPEENISIMAQPMGTLLSISTDNSCKQITDAPKYFKSSMLIFDPGFGTLDVFNIKNRMIESTETFDNLGMKRILMETSNMIMDKYNQEIPVPAMQKYLKTGEIRYRNRKERTTSMVPFGDLLKEANERVCTEAMKKVDNIFNGLYDHDYLVITGGTGAAWFDMIKEYYSGMETLKIINGNQNDNLPCIFSNVRGYYLYLVGKMKQSAKKNG